jgi:FSR family fosmidomycin resistance protein-like MFS transporter
MPKRSVVLSGSSLAALLLLAHAVNDSFSGMLAALLPTFQTRFQASETTLAALVATLSFSSSVTQPVFGALADRLGRRLIGALGVIVTAGLLSLMGITHSIWLLFGLLLVGGLGSAAFHPSGTSMARAAARHTKGVAVGVFSAGGTVGLAFGPLLIGFFVINDILRFTPWLMLPGLVIGVLLYRLVPAQERSPRDNRPKIFDRQLFAGPVGALCLAGILRSIAWVTLINGSPLWLVQERGISGDSPTIFWTLTVFSFFGGIGGILAGYLEQRLGREMVISGSMLVALVPLYALFLVPPGGVAYFLLVAAAGALVNGGLPLMVVSAQDLAPHAMGTASGMLMGLTWGTAGLIYILVGGLQELIGIAPAMAVSFSTLVPGSFLALRVLRMNAAALSAD